MNIFGVMTKTCVYFLGDFRKKDYFLGYEAFVDISEGGSSQNWTLGGGSFLCILGSFLKVKVQNGNIFFLRGGVVKFQIFFGVHLIFLMFFYKQ